MSFMMVVAAAAVAVSGPAAAQADVAAAGGDQASAAKTKLICRSEVETGSLAKKRKICKTRAEWDAQVRTAGDKLEDMRRPINSCGATTPGLC